MSAAVSRDPVGTAVHAIRRLLVACDVSAHGLAALEAAAGLAERTGADLAALFVEDEDLLRFAGLSASRIVDARSGSIGRPDVGAMEREFRALAAEARRALARAALRARVPWTFRVVRGRVAPAVLAAAADTDLVVLGRAGHASHGRGRLGSTARAVVARAPSAVLLLREGEALAPPVLLAYDGTDVADRALDLAAALARGGALRVLAPAHAVPRARERLDRRGVAADVRGVGTLAPRALADAARALAAGVLVVPAPAGTDGERAESLEDVPCSVLLVR